jgi:ABC-2 type transport system permease protein
MLQIRNTWLWSLVLGIFMPLGMVFGFTRIGDATSGGEKLLFIVSGAAVFSVAAEGIMSLAQRVGAIKSTGMLVYYASLPISKGAFIAALVLSRMLLVIPGLMTPILVARFVLGEDFSISPVLLVLFPLTGLTLSAFGMAIGSFIEQPEVIAIATNLLVYVLLLASPVLIPADSLPAPLRFLGYLLPPTYAAEALRFSLRGDLGAGFLLDLAVLTVMAGATLTLAGRWIRWRVA